ncbi:hypothetical protein B0H14DRAFT_2580175 [Mycena olivaceomarginata]|nr:hypothetical protein B0H14DRAFT_2580175 [Mycena olivaceomarginata]
MLPSTEREGFPPRGRHVFTRRKHAVQMTHLDWFEGLSMAFTMEDLTPDPEVIRTQMDTKSQQLDTLNLQLVVLQMGTKGDAADLQAKVQAAQTALNSAQSNLDQTYSNNVISMASACLTEAGKVDTVTLAGKLGIAQAALAQLLAQIEAVRTAQDELNSSSRVLSQMAALALATDTKQQQQQPTLGEKIPAMPLQLPQENSSGGSRWQTISFTSDTTSRTNIANAQGEATSEQCSSSSSGASATASMATKDTIDVTFDATLVTRVNKDISWVDDTDNKVHGLMPGFPVGFLIAKDCGCGVVGFVRWFLMLLLLEKQLKQLRMDSDEAELMPAQLPANFFISDDDYNKAVNGTQPDHDIVTNPAGG